MLAASDAPRTSSDTLDAYLARWMAAWPAEFPPPTTTTYSPSMPGASVIGRRRRRRQRPTSLSTAVDGQAAIEDAGGQHHRPAVGQLDAMGRG